MHQLPFFCLLAEGVVGGVFAVGEDAVAVVDAGIIHHAVEIVRHGTGKGTGAVFGAVYGILHKAAAVGAGGTVAAAAVILLPHIVACGRAGIVIVAAAGGKREDKAKCQSEADDFSSHIASPLSFRYPAIVWRKNTLVFLPVFGKKESFAAAKDSFFIGISVCAMYARTSM